MTTQLEENTVCEACGCAGEIGFIIKEGDDVAEVTIYANGQEALEAELARYTTLAQSVNANVEFEVAPVNQDSQELNARFKFEVSAEKLIFELKSRSLAR
ncbi:DUF406 family protein [Vibrio sp. SM6]|uniref:DUF406 family protein n=1 Tax=Vibrio agarilyticus TaxID=2726741 RepID=A0A7X8TMY1_9VIBR|nr:DUF406 family protein [Vibrio agarilyticus]NLS11706.1 DUF406 family protein [Vibrio agarilyticus]